MPFCSFAVDAQLRRVAMLQLATGSKHPPCITCSPLSSGKHNRIRLRIDRSRPRPEDCGMGFGFGRIHADPHPATERSRPGRRTETKRRQTLAGSSGRMFPAGPRSTGMLQNTFCCVDHFARLVGTNDERCLQLSFIAGANRSPHRIERGNVRVNRQVCGIEDNDLRGEGQG